MKNKSSSKKNKNKNNDISLLSKLKPFYNNLKHKKTFIALVSMIVIIALLSVYLWCCQNIIEIESYNVKTDKIKSSVKIAFISDMHTKEFGENNRRLIKKIMKQEPDLIAIGGDMLSNSDTEHKVVTDLLRHLVDIAPTYYALGNHEKNYVNYDAFISEIKSIGVVFLDNEFTYFSGPEMNGEEIVIGGLSDYPYYDKFAPDYETEDRYFFDEFEAQNELNYCVLLAHQPEFYMWSLKYHKLDLILSGHAHGGVIQLPFIGGIYAPTQKFFPEFDEGFFSSEKANMIVTSGLSISSPPIPRINNFPEVCIVNIN